MISVNSFSYHAYSHASSKQAQSEICLFHCIICVFGLLQHSVVQLQVLNCHDSVIYILAPLRFATIYGCSDATIVLGAVGKVIMKMLGLLLLVLNDSDFILLLVSITAFFSFIYSLGLWRIFPIILLWDLIGWFTTPVASNKVINCYAMDSFHAKLHLLIQSTMLYISVLFG